MFDSASDLEAHGAKLHFFEKKTGDFGGRGRLQKRVLAKNGQILHENLRAERTFKRTDRFVHQLQTRIHAAGFES